MRYALARFKRLVFPEDRVEHKAGGSVEHKHDSEARFWKEELDNYVRWYLGEIPAMYTTASPTHEQKVFAPNVKDSAILTWHALHQEVKYLFDLQLDREAFRGKRLLDVGCGPIPSATCFEGSDLYSLDPLLDRYLAIGFPLHYYGNTKFVRGFSEQIPIADDFFDAVVSVNALDHVDDFEKTAAEIVRVLKNDGEIVLHLHYHQPMQNEPLELNDERVRGAFREIRNFRKIAESHEKMGYRCPDDELFTLWTNRG
jgi:SAM-dependent methyltransferase